MIVAMQSLVAWTGRPLVPKPQTQPLRLFGTEPTTWSDLVRVEESVHVMVSEHGIVVDAPAAKLKGAGRQEAGSDDELRVTLCSAVWPLLVTVML